jgi:mono/diheme cytochrome c family protein
MSNRIHLVVLAGFAVVAGNVFVPTVHAGDRAALLARGEYVLATSGCNDCHSPNGFEKGPTVPKADWLTGLPVGFQGPWGTTYPANLRLTVSGMSESQWLVFARQERRPPMPWLGLKAMTDTDLKAIYAYIRSLGPAGTPVPAYVPPGGTVNTPYFVFVPTTDSKQARAAH